LLASGDSGRGISVGAAFPAFAELAAGLFAAAPVSPLEWAELIARREYGL